MEKYIDRINQTPEREREREDSLLYINRNNQRLNWPCNSEPPQKSNKSKPNRRLSVSPSLPGTRITFTIVFLFFLSLSLSLSFVCLYHFSFYQSSVLLVFRVFFVRYSTGGSGHVVRCCRHEQLRQR
jgi:hypothetical protein